MLVIPAMPAGKILVGSCTQAPLLPDITNEPSGLEGGGIHLQPPSLVMVRSHVAWSVNDSQITARQTWRMQNKRSNATARFFN